jgi:hypothetical protein
MKLKLGYPEQNNRYTSKEWMNSGEMKLNGASLSFQDVEYHLHSTYKSLKEDFACQIA